MSVKRLLVCVLLVSLCMLFGITSAQEFNNITCINNYHHSWLQGVSDIHVEGNYAYLACSSEGLRILDISESHAYREIGNVVYRSIDCLTFSDGYAYLGSMIDGIFIIDVRNPSLTNEVAFIPGNGIITLKIVDNYLYAGFAADGLKVYDISNPSSPILVCDMMGLGLPNDVAIRGTMIYLAAGSRGLKAIDISDLNNPVITGIYTPDYCQEINGVAIDGDYAYMATGEGGFEVVNLNTMQREARIDSLVYAFKIEIEGHYAFVSYGNPECPLAIIDINNPTQPQTVSIYYPPEDMVNFVIEDDLVYVADFYHCLRVVDISDVNNPYETYSYNNCGYDLDVNVYRNYAMVRQEYRMKIIDITDMTDPIDISYLESSWRISNVCPVNDVAFVAKGEEAHVTSVDIGIPNPLNVLDVYTVDNGYSINNIAVCEDYAFVNCPEQFKIIDISDPSNMQEVGAFETGTFIECFDICGDYLLYQTYQNYLRLADISNPLSPAIIATTQMPHYSSLIRAFDGVFYTVLGRNVSIYDMSNLDFWQPRQVLQMGEDGDGINDILVHGNYLLVTFGHGGLRIYDNTDITSPRLIGDTPVDGYALGVTVLGNVAVVACRTNLGFYDLSGVMTDLPEINAPLPEATMLLSNYPNPFNSSTNIQLVVKTDSHVQLEVFDILGRKVSTLIDQQMVAGNHLFSWHGVDDNGQPVASGRYYVTARIGDKLEESLPISLLK